MKEVNHAKLYSYRIGSLTNCLGRPPRFYHSRDLAAGGTRFTSVYALRQEDAECIAETAGTAAGFRGTVWSLRLWVDFDQIPAADEAETFLKREGYDYVAYDTGGGRGRHLGILRIADPSHVLPAQDKAWAKEFLPGCDLGLYWHLHLLRRPGARHEKTGNKKVLLHRHHGKGLVLPSFVPEEVVTAASDLPLASGRTKSIFQCWGVTENLLDNPGQSRHKQLVLLATALRRDVEVQLDEALWVMREVNRGFGVSKPDDEIIKIAHWAYGVGG